MSGGLYDVWIEGRFSCGTGALRHQSEDARRPFRQCRADGETLGEALGEAEAADVQAWLGRMLDLHIQAVEAALDAVDGIEEVQGNPPDHVDLTYYRSQAHYDKFGRDEAVYSVVNARSREIGAILQAEGYTVRYVYPEILRTLFQR